MSAPTLRPARPGRFAAVLDPGSFKTVCLIATLDSEGRPARIAGVGLAPSQGVKAGAVVDLAAAEGTIRSAIAQAEGMAGIQLEQIEVLVNGGTLSSRIFAAAAPVEYDIVSQATLARVEGAGRTHAAKDGRYILQLDTLGYRLDEDPLIGDPVGHPASRIAAHQFVVTADTQPVANLTRTITRCFLTSRRLVPGPIASALAVTSEDERRHGIITIDIGAAVTGFAVVQDGRAIFARTLPIGGGHVTLDIVHALRTPLEEAERIKSVYGTVLNAQSDQHDIFTHALIGDGEGLEQRSTKADLARIIQSRMDQLFKLVRDQLANAGLLDASAARIVLCGGGSEIPGLQSFAESIFRRPVRGGRPQPISGLPPVYASAAFAGVVGVLRAVTESAAVEFPAVQGTHAPEGYIHRVGQWLKDGF